MKRATITFPDALEKKLGAYLAEQRTPPSLSTVVQVALEEYLDQKWAKYEVRLASGPLELTVADEGEVDGAGGDLERCIWPRRPTREGCSRAAFIRRSP